MKPRSTSSSRIWLVVGVVALVGVSGAIWFARGSKSLPIPAVDVSRLEPSARQILEARIAEVRSTKSAGAWGELGSVLRTFDLPREARQCFAEAERLDAANPRWPYFQAMLSLSEDADAAAAALRRTVARCGNEPEMPRFRLARLLSEQGKWNEAETELRALLADKPDFAPATLLLAHRASAGQKTAEAIELALRSTKDPRTAKAAWALLATLYQRGGDGAKAAEAARLAASLRNDEGIADAFEMEAAARRENPREIAMQTHDLLASGRLDEAARNVERLTKGHPQFGETWLLLGRLQILRRQFSEAESSLRRHLELEPGSTQGLFQLGTALFNQNRFAEAADTFAKATEIKPDFGPAHFNRAYALVRAGKRAEAVRYFCEAKRHNPEHVEIYVLLGDLHRQLGERDEALKVVREGRTLAPSEPRLRQLEAQLTSQRQ